MTQSQRTRELVALVMESFRHDDLAAFCRGRCIEQEELAALRAAFVDAGAARVHGLAHPRTWVQINVTLTSASQWARLMKGPLIDRIRALLDEGLVEQLHFVHKPPGIRLRFLGERERLLSPLESAMLGLVEGSFIQTFSRGLYDAEPWQFGGEAGLDAAHEFFTAESMAVLGFHQLGLRRAASMGSPEFSLALLDIFLRQVAGDEWELWDLWNKMELAGRGMPLEGEAREGAAASAMEVGESLSRILRDPGPALVRLPEAERALLLAYREKLPSLIGRLRTLHETGALLFPLRDILPFWIVFHFNRMGFSGDGQRYLSFLMTCLLSPKGTTRPVRNGAPSGGGEPAAERGNR